MIDNDYAEGIREGLSVRAFMADVSRAAGPMSESAWCVLRLAIGIGIVCAEDEAAFMTSVIARVKAHADAHKCAESAPDMTDSGLQRPDTTRPTPSAGHKNRV